MLQKRRMTMIKEQILNKAQTIYVQSVSSEHSLGSMTSENRIGVINAIKLDVVDFYTNHPNCSNKLELRYFASSREVDREVNILSQDGDYFLDIYIDGDWIRFDAFVTLNGEAFRYVVRTHCIEKD